MSYRALGYPLRRKPPLDRLRPLIRPGFASPLLPWTRAHPGGSRTAQLGSDGVWRIVPADTPRFGSVGGQIYKQVTNLIRNPAWLGATPGVLGSGGVAPTNMNGAAGVTWEIIQIAVVNNVPVMDLRITAAGAAATQTFNLETGVGVAFAASTAYTLSLYAQIIAGSTAGFSLLGIRGRTSAATVNVGSSYSLLGVSGSALTLVQGQYTTPADATAGHFQIVLTPSGAADITLRLAFPQFEIGAFATPPVLPADATTAASTVGADLPAALLANFGVPPNGVGTYILRCLLPQPAPAGVTQMVLQIDDGSNANRFFLRNAAGGATLQLGRTLGGVDQVVSLGSMTAGVPFNLGIGIAGDGSAYGSLNGGAVGTVTGGPSSGLLNFRAGNSVSAGASINGEMLASFLRAALSPTALQAAIAAYT